VPSSSSERPIGETVAGREEEFDAMTTVIDVRRRSAFRPRRVQTRAGRATAARPSNGE
jgi:hypothetical protein